MSAEDGKEYKGALVIHSAADLTLKFPSKPASLDEKDAGRTQIAIRKHGAYDSEGRTLVAAKSLANILVTDAEGAKRFYLKLNNDDQLKDGSTSLVAVPAVLKALAQRIEEPRDPYVHERLKYNEGCLKTLRDAPEIERIRVLLESKIRRELPNLKKRKIQAENITECQVTGNALEKDAHAHHVERKSDNPREALNLKNIVLVNEMPHQEIHSDKAGDAKSLSELCKEKGWNDPTKA